MGAEKRDETAQQPGSYRAIAYPFVHAWPAGALFLAFSPGGQPLAALCSVSFVHGRAGRLAAQRKAVTAEYSAPRPHPERGLPCPAQARAACRGTNAPGRVHPELCRAGVRARQSLTLRELTAIAQVPPRWYAPARSQEALCAHPPRAAATADGEIAPEGKK